MRIIFDVSNSSSILIKWTYISNYSWKLKKKKQEKSTYFLHQAFVLFCFPFGFENFCCCFLLFASFRSSGRKCLPFLIHYTMRTEKLKELIPTALITAEFLHTHFLINIIQYTMVGVFEQTNKQNNMYLIVLYVYSLQLAPIIFWLQIAQANSFIKTFLNKKEIKRT